MPVASSQLVRIGAIEFWQPYEMPPDSR
jgi:hypothetical protein